MTDMSVPAVPVSWGELLDKLTILEIKLRRIDDPGARANVEREYRALAGLSASALVHPGVVELMKALHQVNDNLWQIEDAIRIKEIEADFGRDFIQLARSVYRINDERAVLKRRINEALSSELIEEKSYGGIDITDGASKSEHAADRGR